MFGRELSIVLYLSPHFYFVRQNCYLYIIIYLVSYTVDSFYANLLKDKQFIQLELV